MTSEIHQTTLRAPANDASPPGPIPHDLDTPYGRLYRPLNPWAQIAVLFVAFFGGPAIGWLIGHVPGDLSETARTLVYVPFVLVFFTGYALWVARLNAIAFDVLGRSFLKAFLLILLRRRKPESLHEIIPTREKLLQMAVRAQKAGGSFAVTGWPIGLFAGLLGLFLRSDFGAVPLFLLLAGSVIAWGYLLAVLGRRGFLPFMEGE
jgi:hypothetical protein